MCEYSEDKNAKIDEHWTPQAGANLEDAADGADVLRGHAEASARAAHRGVRGRDVRVGAEVQIQH